MVSTSSTTMQTKLGEDRTTRTGCRCENMVFVFLLFVSIFGHAPRPARCSFERHILSKYCVTVYGSTFTMVSPFFRKAGENADFLRQVAPQFSRNYVGKLRKLQKSAEKFVRTTSYDFLLAVVHRSDCSCASILRFFSAASDGATADCQVPKRTFSSIS